QLHAKIVKERQDYPILEGLQPTHWPALFETIQDMKRLLIKQKKQVAHEDMLRNELDEWSQLLKKFTDILHVEDADIMSVQLLENWLYRYDQEQKELQHLKQSLQKLQAEKSQLQETIRYIHKEMDTLFTIAHAVDEESYYEQAERYDQQQKSKQAILQFEQYRKQSFTTKQNEAIMNDSWSEEKISQALDELYKKTQDVNDRKQDYEHRLAEQNVILNEQEQSDLLATLTLEYEVEKALLNELAEKWLVYKVAYDVLQKAKMRYQEKYMEQITQLMTSYFRQMTNGKYVSVYAPAKQAVFIVETKDRMRFDVTQLSKGTIDQLYIALRLAIGVV